MTMDSIPFCDLYVFYGLRVDEEYGLVTCDRLTVSTNDKQFRSVWFKLADGRFDKLPSSSGSLCAIR